MNILVTTGRFNLVHSGHIELIKDASQFDKVVIGVCVGKANKVSYVERREALLSLAHTMGISTKNIEIVPIPHPFELIDIVLDWFGANHCVTIRLGQDREKLANQLKVYFSSHFLTKVSIIKRNSCSSSACRSYFSSNGGTKGLHTYWNGDLFARSRAYKAYCKELEKVND